MSNPIGLLDRLIRRAALAAVRACEGDVTEAAERLGVPRATLYAWLRRWRADGVPGVPPPRKRGPRGRAA